jgi:hypothetical protein
MCPKGWETVTRGGGPDARERDLTTDHTDNTDERRLIQLFVSVPICASSSLSSTLTLDSTEVHRSQTRREPEVHASESKTIRGSKAFSMMPGRVPQMSFFCVFFDRNPTKSRRFRYIFDRFLHIFRRMFGQNPRF